MNLAVKKVCTATITDNIDDDDSDIVLYDYNTTDDDQDFQEGESKYQLHLFDPHYRSLK